jgi:hypothetical protein
MMFKIEKIRRDGGTQIRESINPTVVDEYAESWKLGSKFPKVTVFHDGTNYWLADGFHRIEGAIKAGLEKVDCDVRPGTIRDAILWACGCNERHGLRRSRKDRKAAIMKLLNDEKWHTWSDNEIAKQCDVSSPTVAKYRPESIYKNFIDGERVCVRNGTEYTVEIGNIGRDVVPPLATPSNSSHNGTPDSASSASAVATEEPPDPVSDPADDDQEPTEEVSEAASQPESSPDPVTPAATKLCPCCHGTGRVPIDFEEHAHS